MSVRGAFFLSFLALLGMVSGCQRASVHQVGAIQIEQPWVRAMAPNAPAAGGFVVLRNAGSESDRLVSVSTADAGRVEIHEVRTDQGVMQMRPLPGGVALPAESTVELKPGGYHLMLIAPRRRLAKGETVRMALRFERAGLTQVDFPVMPIGATNGGPSHH
jgi:copper(I)-binding protein